jgi:hypothetical protein
VATLIGAHQLSESPSLFTKSSICAARFQIQRID